MLARPGFAKMYEVPGVADVAVTRYPPPFPGGVVMPVKLGPKWAAATLIAGVLALFAPISALTQAAKN